MNEIDERIEQQKFIIKWLDDNFDYIWSKSETRQEAYSLTNGARDVLDYLERLAE